MDSLKSAFSGGDNKEQQGSGEQKKEGGFLGGLGDKLNSAAGGGRESEKNEDYLDKGECSTDIVPLPSSPVYRSPQSCP